MGHNFSLVVHLPKYPRISRQERIEKKPRSLASAGRIVLGQKTLSVTLMILLLLFGFLYLVLVNSRVTKGFEIKKLEQRVFELNESQKQLQHQVSDLQSIQNIEKHVNLADYVPTQNITYLQEGNVARK